MDLLFGWRWWLWTLPPSVDNGPCICVCICTSICICLSICICVCIYICIFELSTSVTVPEWWQWLWTFPTSVDNEPSSWVVDNCRIRGAMINDHWIVLHMYCPNFPQRSKTFTYCMCLIYQTEEERSSYKTQEENVTSEDVPIIPWTLSSPVASCAS